MTIGQKKYDTAIPYFKITDSTPNTVTIKVHDDVIFDKLERKNFSHCILSASVGGFAEGRSPSCTSLDTPGSPIEDSKELIPFTKDREKRTITIGDASKDTGFDPMEDVGLFRIGCASCTTNIWITDFIVVDPITKKEITREFSGLYAY